MAVGRNKYVRGFEPDIKNEELWSSLRQRGKK